MPIVLGVDLGTTTITAVAADAAEGRIVGGRSVANTAQVTSADDRRRGRSEWDARRIAALGEDVLREVGKDLGSRRQDVAAIGVTGQQHGVVLLDARRQPLSPLINWQDRRGEETFPGTDRSFVEQAMRLAGDDAPLRAGCRLAAGYMGVTLLWLKTHGQFPAGATATLVMDYFASTLTGRPPASDPSSAASSGLCNTATRDWDDDALAALGLPRSLLGEVREADRPLGPLTGEAARRLDLPRGVPVSLAIGDNQAAFLGSVADRRNTMLINVGTGGQTAGYTDRFVHEPPLETRPFPLGGNLLVLAGLCGGRTYAVLENFFQRVGRELFGSAIGADASLMDAMNRLAADVPPGAEGLVCRPLFSGTRENPALRASWTGASAENFTPGHATRALLEGMGEVFADGRSRICQAAEQSYEKFVGAGGALRQNPVLRAILARRLGRPLLLARHREEAAHGAARLATVPAGIHRDLEATESWIEYEPEP